MCTFYTKLSAPQQKCLLLWQIGKTVNYVAKESQVSESWE